MAISFFSSKWWLDAILDFKIQNFDHNYILIVPAEWMIPAKMGLFRTSYCGVIAILVNFNRRPAAILDFAKFHF